MKLGLQVNRFSWPGAPASTGATWRAVARDADQCGLASLWVMDHFFQIAVVGPPELDMLEGYTTLAHAAAVTEQIELGTLVTGVTYRHPGILLKTVTTLDVLSGGRAWLGIGAAWNEEEHRGLGVPYPSTRERFRLLEDTLQLAHQMFADDDSPFEGEPISLERPMNHPQPLRRVRRSWSAAGESSARCGWSRSTPTRATCSTSGSGRRASRTSSTSSAGTATTSGATTTRSRRPAWPGSPWTPAPRCPTASSRTRSARRSSACRCCGDAGIDHVIFSMANTTDPAAYPLVAEVVRQVA